MKNLNWKIIRLRNPQRGQCYKNTYKFAELNRGWKVCHGIVLGTGPTNKGQPMGHAWLERSSFVKLTSDLKIKVTTVYDVFTNWTGPMELFYHCSGLTHIRRYTLAQAQANLLRTRNYGPWDAKIKKAKHSGPIK